MKSHFKSIIGMYRQNLISAKKTVHVIGRCPKEPEIHISESD